MYQRIALDAGSDAGRLVAPFETARHEGAIGVVLEPRDARNGSQVPAAERFRADALEVAAGLAGGEPDPLEVLVEVASSREAEEALEGPASGIVVSSRTGAGDVRGIAELMAASTSPGTAWVPERLTAAFEELPDRGWSFVVEVEVSALGGRPEHPKGALLGCAIPAPAAAGPGAVEALTTIAVAGGVRRLLAHDTRVVRRCADVAMELVLAERRLEASDDTAEEGVSGR